MRITTRGRYALRASLTLAELGRDGSPVSINNISEQEHISSLFLEQIFFKLRKAGVVSSVRGPGGGFYFARSLECVTLKDILDAVGEELEFVPCDKIKGKTAGCKQNGGCPLHPIWLDVTKLLSNYFKSVTLASILERSGLEKR